MVAMITSNLNTQLSRLVLKIVVMTRELLTGKRFWVTLLFVTYVGFFRLPT
jgi:hypothetical protein